MEHFRSILWQKLNLAVGPLNLLDLAVHRHLPETTSLGTHKHSFGQFLVYLTGHGIQNINAQKHYTSAGTLAAIPPRIPHSFTRSGKRPALCLVIDFKFPPASRMAPCIKDLSSLDLASIRETVSEMVKLGPDSGLPWEMRRAILTMKVVEILLLASGWFPARRTSFRSPIIQKVEAILRNPASDHLSPGEIAASAGYQSDYLNRIVKAQTGLTLGQWKSRERIARAKIHLRKTPKISDAAEASGFPDQNYFARWFKNQTGLSPSQWLRIPSSGN